MAVVGRADAATVGPVLVIGTGLIGTSIALALRACGVAVQLWDPSPTSLALAADMGAGEKLAAPPGRSTVGRPDPAIVVVAAPPDVSGGIVAECLRVFPYAIVTDVASVKEAVVMDLEATASNPAFLSRYVGSHPMAGRARSGASHADGDLFVGRPWVIVPTEYSSGDAILQVRNLAVDVGAVPMELGKAEHDRAVALVSHVPQLV